MTIEYKSFDVKQEGDSESMTLTGYGSTFGNVDENNDVVVKSAFMNSLVAGKEFPLLWQHEMDSPIGKFTAIEDEKGLLITATLADIPRARDARELAKMGVMKLSIGYEVLEFSKELKDGAEIRKLESLNLHEVSMVTFPANEKAVILSVKNIKSPDISRNVARVKGMKNSLRQLKFAIKGE